MKLGKYIKDRLYSVCIFAAMLIISVLMMAAFKVSVQLIIAEIFIMTICYIAVVLADYYHRKKFYDELEINIAALAFALLRNLPKKTIYRKTFRFLYQESTFSRLMP